MAVSATGQNQPTSCSHGLADTQLGWLVPGPAITAHLVQRAFGVPLRALVARVGSATVIAASPGRRLRGRREFLVRWLLRRPAPHRERVADTASEVADEVLRFLIEQRYESGLVAFCEIHDVDVVAYSSAVMVAQSLPKICS